MTEGGTTRRSDSKARKLVESFLPRSILRSLSGQHERRALPRSLWLGLWCERAVGPPTRAQLRDRLVREDVAGGRDGHDLGGACRRSHLGHRQSRHGRHHPGQQHQ